MTAVSSTKPSNASDRHALLGVMDARTRWRYLKDRFARWGVAVGGLGVIVAIMLIFFYLAYVVLPLFAPAKVTSHGSYALQPAMAAQQPWLLAMEEQAEIGVRLGSDGQAHFFDVATGALRETVPVIADGEPPAVAFDIIDRASGRFAIALADGSVRIAEHSYRSEFTDGVRTIIPGIAYPYGEGSLALADGPVDALEVRTAEESVLLAGVLPGNQVRIARFVQEVGLFGGAGELEADTQTTLNLEFAPTTIRIDPQQAWLYALSADGRLAFWSIRDLDNPQRIDLVTVAEGESLRQATFLNGGISLMLAEPGSGERGLISQWFPVRNDDNSYRLQRVRDFKLPAGTVTDVDIEQRRRGFAVGTDSGKVALYYATSKRRLANFDVGDVAVRSVALAPRADTMLVETADGQLHRYDIHNEHPEISMGALWGKVWYESYPEPDYVWQSSSATNDFEPKFSLTPLSFGTMKAAFYAMLFALPLAIFGAIYTAYFMSPQLRQLIKPTIEIMEALPTVILGFLAGLFLAPYLELNMPGAFLLLLLLPPAIPLAGFLWTRLPPNMRYLVPDGWAPVLLIPVVIAVAVLAFSLSNPVEAALFGGSMPNWLTNELGIDYDQRNSLVVGIAMGFAVIPTIFSIAEDAIFSVPKQLSQGSLALGATPWQTLVRVVLPTASPGMFSAVMIGMGRAVGETMIVLMATGNTPIMDMSIFQGMRTLSANIAVEMPESEVGSTHFRILFLAGLVLFMFTFVFNTVAEVVRQRLRRKYSDL